MTLTLLRAGRTWGTEPPQWHPGRRKLQNRLRPPGQEDSEEVLGAAYFSENPG